MPPRLQKYIFTHNQLQTYLQMFTGENDVVVLTDSQPLTHIPSKVVGLPIGTPHAATSASHEGLHILHSSHAAMQAMKNNAERAVLNVLDDGRIERLSFRTKPGLRPQFQEDINDLTNVILKEGWLSQSLKAMYLQVTGYDFPYDKLHPKAQNILAKFAVFIPQVRKANDDMELVPIVPKVLALFDERIEPPPMPQRSQPEPGGNPDDDGEEDEDEDGWPDEGDESEDDGEGEGEESDDRPRAGNGKAGKKPGTGVRGKDPGSAIKDPNAHHEPTEAEKSLAERMREGMQSKQRQADKVRKQHGGPVNVSEDGDDADFEGEYEREGIEYDADEARNQRLAAERNGATAGDTTATKKRGENVIGGDTVTGGPTVNQLMLQADKVKKDLDAIEAKRKRNALAALTRAKNNDEETGYLPGGGYVPYVPPSIEDDKEEEGVRKARLPKSMAAVANMHKAMADAKPSRDRYGYYGYQQGKGIQLDIDWKALLGDQHGGTGYSGGTGWWVEDRRTVSVPTDMAIAEAAAKQFQATSNYLARQLRVFMQTDERKNLRSYERMGVLDNRRAYQMGVGRFDIFREQGAASDSRPAVCMTTDMSGSMGSSYSWGRSGEAAHRGHCLHALNASIVVAQALHRLRIPFEAHGFHSWGHLYKSFSDPWDYRALGGLSNLLQPTGGTSAAEATAIAWARLMSRPEPRKIVFVVSDGGVANNTLDMAKAIEAAGGVVVGIGIGKGYIGRYFPHSVEVNNASELPAVFTKLLRNLLPTGKWTTR